jgi:peptide/nickel transport system substrate-binding protein
VTDSTSAPAAQYRKRRKRRTPFIVATVIVALVVIAAAVWGISSWSKRTQSKDTIGIGLILEPTNLNIRETAGVALDQILIDNVYQGLVGLEPGTVDKIRPVLAKNMPKISKDGKTYTFKLRDDVTFHSGNALTSEDVVSSLSETLTNEVLDTKATITAPDKSTVRIELDEPNSQLLFQLASRPGLILEKDAKNDLSNSANGTGPYELASWRQSDSVTLKAHADYWGEKASIENVVFRFIPDGRAAVNAVRDGDVDVQTALLPTLRKEFENDDDVKLVRAESTDVFTLAYNSEKAPFDDIRVRQAISRAIDSDALIKAQSGDGKPVGSPITELEPGYKDLTSVNKYDPDSAKQLLDDAGAKNLSLTITAPNHYEQSALDIISSQLQQVGISVKVKPVEFGTWLETVYTNHDFELSYIDHAEPRDFANYADPDYYFGYKSKKVRSLYTDALHATDPSEADDLLKRASEQVAKDAPAKWLFNYTPTSVIRNTVHGFPEANTNSRIPLEGVTITQ